MLDASICSLLLLLPCASMCCTRASTWPTTTRLSHMFCVVTSVLNVRSFVHYILAQHARRQAPGGFLNSHTHSAARSVIVIRRTRYGTSRGDPPRFPGAGGGAWDMQQPVQPVGLVSAVFEYGCFPPTAHSHSHRIRVTTSLLCLRERARTLC